MSTISRGFAGYTDEQVDDRVNALIVAGANVTKTYDDAAGTLTISAATTGASGIPATTVDAKGDLIAGTANDTVARLGVGTNGQVLTASSGATTGLAWTTFTGGTATGAMTAINVKDAPYSATGNGTTNDRAAIQAAIDAAEAGGGTVYLPAGVYLVGSTLVIPAGVHLRGAGIGGDIFSTGSAPYRGTVIRLADGANVDVIQTKSFATLTGTTLGSNTAAPHRFGLHHLVIDGNKANNATGWCARLYGLTYEIDHVVFQNGGSGGVYTELTTGGYEMEAKWSNFAITDNDGPGLEFRGPHDSLFSNGVVARNVGYPGIHLVRGASIGAAQFVNVHVWGAHTQSWIIGGFDTSMVNCVADGAGVQFLDNGNQWIGGCLIGTAVAGEVAFTLGDGTNTLYISNNRIITRLTNYAVGAALFRVRNNTTFGSNHWSLTATCGSTRQWLGEGASTTTGSITFPVTSIALTNASGFPSGGDTCYIGNGSIDTTFVYTGKTGNTLTGVTGGSGTFAAGSAVFQTSGPVYDDRLEIIDAENQPNGIYSTFPGTIRSGRSSTGSRPSASLSGAGAMWYDTTLGKPIWSTGSVWKDAAGTTV